MMLKEHCLWRKRTALGKIQETTCSRIQRSWSTFFCLQHGHARLWAASAGSDDCSDVDAGAALSRTDPMTV